MKKKIIVGLCALLLMALIGATIPSAFAANDQIYFTAVNETVLALNDSTMPFFSGGSFYVPYTIFESTVTGENVGLFTSYSRAKGAVLIYNMSGSLLFDLNENNSVYNGTLYSESAIIRNSTVFIPINMVCRFFELDWAWLFSSQGSVIRLKSPAASLSDQEFITAANYTLNERLRAYLQNQTPYPTGGPTVSPSPTPSTPVTDGAQVRIAHLMGEESNEFPKLLDTRRNRMRTPSSSSPRSIFPCGMMTCGSFWPGATGSAFIWTPPRWWGSSSSWSGGGNFSPPSPTPTPPSA